MSGGGPREAQGKPKGIRWKSESAREAWRAFGWVTWRELAVGFAAKESMGGRVGFSQHSARSAAARSEPIDKRVNGKRRDGIYGVGSLVASHEVQEVARGRLLLDLLRRAWKVRE